jgi:hypothetical protein
MVRVGRRGGERGHGEREERRGERTWREWGGEEEEREGMVRGS